MTYAEILKRGTMNEVAISLVEMIGEAPHQSHYATQYITEALIEFYERGLSSAARSSQEIVQ